MIKLRVKKLYDQATIPTKKFPTDAGWDLYSAQEVAIPANEQRVIHTGIQIAEFKDDYIPITFTGLPNRTHISNVVLQLWSRSGMDAEKGLHVGAGIIDQSYRGEILVLLKNMSNKTQYILVGDKIAQAIPLYLPYSEVEEVEDIEESDRGEAGGINEFQKGSTNVYQ